MTKVVGVLKFQIAGKRRKFSVAELNASSMIIPMPKVTCYYAHSSPMIKGNDQHKTLTESLHMEKEAGERGKQKKRP